jgi:hypothetical protein
MAYEVLNARVKQKVDTEANWIADEPTLGVILDGEQAFVIDEAGVAVNFKIGDGTKLFSELPYFIAYYTGVTSQKVLSYLNQSANITIASTIRNKSFVQDVIMINNSGADITLRIGTTDGGNEIIEVAIPVGAVVVGLKEYFEAPTTLYFTGLTGKAFSMFLLYFQLDEAPAIPPTPVGSFRFPRGFRGTFEPLSPTHATEVWDFTTGLGKPDTGYDNCALSGTNGTKDMANTYEVGVGIGDNPNDYTGDNEQSLTYRNLPQMKVTLPANIGGAPGSGGIAFPGANNNPLPLVFTDMAGNTPPATPDPFSIQPYSIKSLKFVAITD